MAKDHEGTEFFIDNFETKDAMLSVTQRWKSPLALLNYLRTLLEWGPVVLEYEKDSLVIKITSSQKRSQSNE